MSYGGYGMLRIINTTPVEMKVKCLRPKYYGKVRDVKINVLENEVKIKTPEMVSCKSYSEKAEWCQICLVCIFSKYKHNPKEKYDEVQDFNVHVSWTTKPHSGR